MTPSASVSLIPLMYYNNRRVGRLLTLVLALTVVATAALAQGCNVVEPDPLQISWTAPCEDGSWLLDPQTGCRLWDWHPDPEDTATWSGACPGGLKEGAGIVQWFEHGRPIDRFEGVFEHGKRKGFGRYYWPAGQRFEGYYDDDLPNGQGTITIDGVSHAGIWRRGCLAHKDKLIAIGAPLSTCTGGHSGKIAEKMGVTSGRPLQPSCFEGRPEGDHRVLTETGQTSVAARLAIEKAGAMATYLPLLKFDRIYAALAAREINAGALPVDLRFGGQARYGCPTMLPGAFSGSVCGRRLSGKPSSTIGFERRHNAAFRIEDEDAFVQFMQEDIPLPPPRAAELRGINAGSMAA